jgi:hypothetical protein
VDADGAAGCDEDVAVVEWIVDLRQALVAARCMAYDLGYIDLEQKTLQPIDNPFGTRVSPMS